MIIKILEWKNGRVYKTKELGKLWVKDNQFYDLKFNDRMKLEKESKRNI